MSENKSEDRELYKMMIDKIQNVGHVQGLIGVIIRHPIFDNLSKYDPLWDLNSDNKQEGLNTIRISLVNIRDGLNTAYDLLENED